MPSTSRKEFEGMPRSTTRCASCPVARKKTHNTMLMRPLFLDEATPWPPADLHTQRQERALREAIAPYLCIADLRRLAASSQNIQQVLLARHARITEPINNLVMLLLGLPFILSRERNIKSSAAMCLLTVGMFFAFIQICHHLNVPAALAAWLPTLLFGPVAVVMLDSVKT